MQLEPQGGLPAVRTRVTRRTAVLFSFVLLFNTQSVTAVSPVDPQTLDTAIRYRASFGFSTDVALVTALEVDSAADRHYSVALSPDERTEMDRRMRMQELLPPLLEYAQTYPNSFGGMHVDQASGGVVHFAFTGDAATHRVKLEALAAPIGAVVRVREVARTDLELRAFTDEIAQDAGFHRVIGVTVHKTAMNTEMNRVDVFIEPFTEAAALAFAERYGLVAHVVPGLAPQTTWCTTRDDCPGNPIMGGVSNDWGCTVGFGIWMDGQRRFLTAGHCIVDVVKLYGWGGWTWWHGQFTQYTPLGLSTDHSFWNWSAADAGSMGNVPAGVHSNNVLVTTQPTWHNIFSGQPAGNKDWVGMAVCQSGQTSGWTCGQITNVSVAPCYAKYGICLKWQRQANYFVQQGDSGAPVVSQATPTMAVGLQSGMDGPFLPIYSHISQVLQPNGPNGGIGAQLWFNEY